MSNRAIRSSNQATGSSDRGDQTYLAEERSRLGRLRAATAPYKKLPYELLSRIIKETSKLSLHYTPNRGFIPNCKTAPWTFRQVCSTWRQAALSYYEFWNDLRFNFLRIRSASLDFWAQNIGDPCRPISISGLRDEGQTELVFQKIVIPYHQSIVSLDIEASEALSLLPPGCFQTLRDLTVSLQNPSYMNVPCFVGMDSLRYLRCSGHNGFSFPVATIPNQLTSLILDILDLSVIIQALHRCHNNLTHLSIGVIINLDTFTEYDKPDFTLPHLKSFFFIESIRQGSHHLQHTSKSLLNHLTLPDLEILSIIVRPGDNDVDFPSVPLLALFERSKCPLRVLRIFPSGMKLVRSELPLDSLQNLVILDARDIVFSHTTISRIAAGELIPNIQELLLSVLEMSSVERLKELRETRARNGNPMTLLLIRVLEIQSYDPNGGYARILHEYRQE